MFVSEFYLAARENRSGNQNKPGFPVVDTQQERVAGFRRTLETLVQIPYVVDADWKDGTRFRTKRGANARCRPGARQARD